MKSFSELNINQKILAAIAKCGYETPTEIQAKAIPLILAGEDVIGATETGNGKTAAFVIPILQRLGESKKQPHARALILTPTRELANQITDAINRYGDMRVANIIGGASYREQERMLSRPVDIIVATPGRLIDHLQNKRINLSTIETFVLDEADRMLDMGFVDDVKLIAKFLPKEKQTLLFTATLDPRLIKSVGYLLNDPKVVNLSRETKVPSQINQQLFIASDQQNKLNFLENLLEKESIFKGIIFAGTKHGADKIAYHLRNKGHHALALHGNLKQRVRKQSLEKLSTGKIQFLVATDIASRGIDIKNISHVINFDLPRCSDDYIHRVGRTGRAGQSGTAITLALRDEKKYIFSIEKRVGSQLQLINYDREPEVRTFDEPQRAEKKPFRKRRPGGNPGGNNTHRARSDKPRYGSSNNSQRTRSEKPR